MGPGPFVWGTKARGDTAYGFLTETSLTLALISRNSHAAPLNSASVGPREGRKVLELVSQRTGTVKCWFNGEGGYDFILPDKADEAVFVHHSGIAARTEAKPLNRGSPGELRSSPEEDGRPVGEGRLQGGTTRLRRVEHNANTRAGVLATS